MILFSRISVVTMVAEWLIFEVDISGKILRLLEDKESVFKDGNKACTC